MYMDTHMGAGGGRGGAGAICNESLRMKRQLVCTFVAPNNELIRITLGLMSPSRLRMCVCVSVENKTVCTGLQEQ